MMADRDRQILDLFVARVRDQYPDADIWAFGSRARGDATWESDLDVCVVDNDLTQADHYTIGDIAWEVGFEHGLVIIPICFTREAFGRGPMSASTLVANILREGVTAAEARQVLDEANQFVAQVKAYLIQELHL